MGLMLSTLNQHIEVTHHCLATGNLTDARQVELAHKLATLLTERYHYYLFSAEGAASCHCRGEVAARRIPP